ncbi:hypothetical protein L4C33_19345 [Vibrio makurazakiensis]|uniref:hypothetical protein n=1 Tax=Vibrio makurazakiensis TaxID=2910250 RepID=UPI003D0FB570
MIYQAIKINNYKTLVEGVFFSAILILMVFPDVIFNEGSLRITDQIFGYKVSSLIEFARTTGWWGGYHDNGGASFQAEPMMEFMLHSISEGQSPYWNPYSSGGALGPETLVDQKFSLLTILYAILGGGSLIYNIISMLVYFFSLLFMYLIVRSVLKFSILSSVAGCVFFLLNGFSVANMGSNIIQSYFYIPMCIYFSFILFERFTSVRVVAVILSFAILLSCTFMPTTITSFLSIYTIIIGFLFSRLYKSDGWRGVFKYLLQHVFLVVLSVLLVSFIYFPIFENISSSGTISDYSKRIFFPLYFPNAISSFFSPSHFFESYNAMEPGALYWIGSRSFPGNTVYHLGIVGISLLSCAFLVKGNKYNYLVLFSLITILLVLCRMFDAPFIGSVVSKLPIIGSLGAHYWWPAIIVPSTFLIVVGVENLKSGTAKVIPVIATSLLGIAGLSYVYNMYGLQEPNVNFKLMSLYIIAFLFVFSILLITLIKLEKLKSHSHLLLLVLVVGLFVELFYSSKMMRLQRNDYFVNPPHEITFLKTNAKYYRTMNFGQTGLRPELGSAFQIQEITSMNQGVLPEFLDYYYSTIDLEIPQRFGYHSTMMPDGAFPTTLLIKDTPELNKINLDKLSLLGVKYITIPAHYSNYASYFDNIGYRKVFDSPTSFIFENTNVLPRAFIIEPRYLSENQSLRSGYESALNEVKIDKYENTKVNLSGYSENGGVVVLTDNFHENWNVTLNGMQVGISKVEGLFRGVLVSKGEFEIKMSYEPKTLIVSKVTSLLVLIALFTLLIFRNRVDTYLSKREFGVSYVD